MGPIVPWVPVRRYQVKDFGKPDLQGSREGKALRLLRHLSFKRGLLNHVSSEGRVSKNLSPWESLGKSLKKTLIATGTSLVLVPVLN